MQKFRHLMIVAILALFITNEISAQVVFNQTTPGTYSFTVSSTTQYKIQCWGGGGRGGPRANNDGGSGGAGGGAYSCSILTLNPGTYTVKVGTGGKEPGNADGDSSYIRNGTLLVLAMGGSGVNSNSATGTAGGQAALGIGSVKYSGGNGANATSTFGGGGGSSAGTSANGNNGTTSTGGSAPTGGAKGGNGRTGADGTGFAGDPPGGGGGGAKKTSSGGGPIFGGFGGNGQVTIALACIPVSIDVAASNQTVECDGSGNTAALNAWLGNHGGATSKNGCGTITWTNNFTGLSDGCGATGSATVVFTVTDGNGNTATSSATFTIVDTTAPTAVCQNVNLEFDQYGHASTTAEDVDNGSSDACSGVTLSLSQTEFDCTDLGGNTVTLTVTDDCGNSSTCTATVTVTVPLAWRCHNNEKVIFCHVPPNYPAQNIQEVCVSMDIQTICDHLGHGDHFGTCDGTEVGFASNPASVDPAEGNDNVTEASEITEHAGTATQTKVLVQPNPFNNKTTISFSVNQKENVTVNIYNNTGKLVQQLFNGQMEAGKQSLNLDGSTLSSGFYYYTLVKGNEIVTGTLIVSRS